MIAAGAALVAMGSLTSCSPTTEKEAPSTTSTPTSTPATSATTPSASPTEKAVGPGTGGSFSPTINPTPPGAVCKEVVNGVCIR